MSPPDHEPRPGLTADDLEALFQRLAELIDETEPARRLAFVAKAFILLADRHGLRQIALDSLEAAAAAAHARRGAGR